MDCPPNPLWGRLYFVFNPLKRNRWEHRVTSFSDINAFGRSRATSASTAHATYHPCSAREVLYRSRRLSDFVMECCTAFCGLLKILGRINVPWTDRYGAPSCRGHLAVFAPVPPLSGTSRRDTPKEGPGIMLASVFSILKKGEESRCTEWESIIKSNGSLATLWSATNNQPPTRN